MTNKTNIDIAYKKIDTSHLFGLDHVAAATVLSHEDTIVVSFVDEEENTVFFKFSYEGTISSMEICEETAEESREKNEDYVIRELMGFGDNLDVETGGPDV